MFLKQHNQNISLALPIAIINGIATIVVILLLIVIMGFKYKFEEEELARNKLTLFWTELLKSDDENTSGINTVYNRDLLTSSKPYGIRIANRKNVTLLLNYPNTWRRYSLRNADFEDAEMLDKSFRLKVHENDKTYSTNIRVFTLSVKDYYVQILISLEERINFIRRIVEIASITILLIMVLSFFIANMVISRLLRPLNVMNSLVEEIIKNKKINQRLSDVRKGEFDRLQENFNTMLDVIEKQVNRLKQTTINIGHDIRTPLTRIRNQLEEMLVNSNLNENDREKVEKSIVFIDDTKVLAKQILDLSEIEDGLVNMPDVPIDVSKTLEPLIEMYSMVAEDKEVYFYSQIDENVRLYMDPTRLKQMVGNLLDNAVKFTNEGKNIFLRINQYGNNIQIEVEDEGIGISDEDIPNIFKYSWKHSSPEKNEEYVGSGFGLAIVESIVMVYHGNIEVSSEVGKGTKFVITFTVH